MAGLLFKRTVFSIICGLLSLSISAQEVAWRDTLKEAVKTAEKRRAEISLGRTKTNLEGIRSVVSPIGEGDPIRWALSLPGVATGADGTTAMYVRGGSSGNNLFTLDGVPVYGYSHILGLTTIIPTAVISSAELSKGGFDGSESNFTAAHLQIETKQPSDIWRASVSLNNFLASVGTEGTIGKWLSFLLSARISPLTWEYRAMRSYLPDLLNGFDSFDADVGDVYAKLSLKTGPASSIEASFLGSMDRYSFGTPDISHEMMGWNNIVGMLRYRQAKEKTTLELTASINRYGSFQEQDKEYRETVNHLSLSSSLDEYGLMTSLRHLLSNRFVLSEGFNIRYAQFAPGQISDIIIPTDIFLASAWAQVEYIIPDHFSAKAVMRGNYYRNYKVFPLDSTGQGSYEYKQEAGEHKDPEMSMSVKWQISQHFALELTGDRLIQYYHTLEGLPVGWSLDMIVPTGENVLPETSMQGNIGLSGQFGSHHFSVGGFYKRMENLIYYKYSQALFNGALAEWEDHVELGNGRSYGLEALYEYQFDDWYAKASYTLSKTTREDFPSFYEGRPFHARFDRRHMLNATAQWRGFSATLILQSGHWENGEAETYPMPYLSDMIWTADYYSGVNNYHMPTVFRLDIGWQTGFKTGRLKHIVNVGVCNVTNHFNPFMLYFDTRTESWKEIALLPILPNFSWRVEF